MRERKIKDLEKEYKIDLKEVVKLIKKEKAKLVLLQFPDGLKQYAVTIVDYLESKTKAKFLIYLGSCYGACDLPLGIEKIGVDLLIQFGHNSLFPTYLK